MTEIGTAGEQLERIRETHVLALLHEAQYIPPLTTGSIATPHLFRRIHLERGRLLIVEWTARLPQAPGLLKVRHVFPYDLFDGRAQLHLIDGALEFEVLGHAGENGTVDEAVDDSCLSEGIERGDPKLLKVSDKEQPRISPHRGALDRLIRGPKADPGEVPSDAE